MYRNVKGNRITLSILAQTLVQSNQMTYYDSINNSIESAIIYRDNSDFREKIKSFPQLNNFPSSIVTPHFLAEDTRHAIFEIDNHHPHKKKVLLVIANYKNAGGGFLKGEYHQEQAICHHSTLYNILSSPVFEKEYYQINRRKTREGLYTNSAIYIPDVVYFNKNGDKKLPYDFHGELYEYSCYNNPTLIDMIICSPPRYNPHPGPAIFQRVDFIKTICEINNVELLIAPTWTWTPFRFDYYHTTHDAFCHTFKTSTTIKDFYLYSEPLVHYIHNTRNPQIQDAIATIETMKAGGQKPSL